MIFFVFSNARVLNSPYLASATNMGDGLIRAWEMHRQAANGDFNVSRYVFLFADGNPTKGPEVGDGNFKGAVKLISRRMQEGNFSGTSLNLNPDANSSFKNSILIYTSSVSSQVKIPKGITAKEAIDQFERFLRYVLKLSISQYKDFFS